MLLAFSRDLRVVLLRLASRLQTLRFFAASKTPCPPDLAAEAMQVFAPLANRLGIWQIKWELEDLAFRFLDPEQYRTHRRLLDERRADREARVAAMRASLAADLAAHGLRGRGAGPAEAPLQHLEEDAQEGPRLRRGARHASRCASSSPTSPACYAVLGRVHERCRAIAGEFDDYIARPKANGYRSLHTVVAGRRRRRGRDPDPHAEMHEHAEYGVSAHWAYKEADAGRARGRRAAARSRRRSPQARLVVLRQLLAWERDLAERGTTGALAGAAAAAASAGLRRPHLRLHAAGRGGRAHRRGDADRLRLRGAHRSRPSLPRRQGRRRGRAAEHARCRAGRWSR